MYWKATVHTHKGDIHFEFEQFPEKTVVALNATLDEFKGVPITQNGMPMIKYPEKTFKDCTNIDGCVYIHLGTVPDSTMVELIGIFLKALEDKKLWTPVMGSAIIN